jgi:hypothetical protein
VDFPALDEDARKREVEELGRHLMQAIGASSRWCRWRWWRRCSFRGTRRRAPNWRSSRRPAILLREWEARGAHIYIPRHDQDYAIGVGLRMLTLRHEAGFPRRA